ncbi:MAG: DUF1080 domain-containing protein [Sedimentisphaerales bacterium]
MRSNIRTDLYILGPTLLFAVFAWIFIVCFAEQSQAEKGAGRKPNGNNKCYVCHPSLKTEKITTVHLKMDISCDECHGPSVEHMHDEMLMTKPDLLFGRAEVDKMCSNPMCHKSGGNRDVYGWQEHQDPAAVKAFYKKWLGRTRPNGRTVTAESVCTDCHGKHNLDQPIREQSEQQPAEWIAAFNGRDLTGWKSSGNASWIVKEGRIIAKPAANGEGGDLWAEAVYQDYLLVVTFRATWPIHAGIWLRAAPVLSCESKNGGGPRIEIFDSQKPVAFTGSVWVPGKGLALVNLRDDLLDRESWNTISVKLQGDRIQVWLNGQEVGAIRTGGLTKGQIGLHLEKHPACKAGQWHIREVLIQRLTEPEESAAKLAESRLAD